MSVSYRTYLSEVGWWLWGGIVFLIALGRVVPVVQQLWLKFWGESYTDAIKLFFATLFTFGPTSPVPHHLSEGTMSSSAFSVSHPWFKFPPANENPDPYLWMYFFIGARIFRVFGRCNGH